MKREWLELRWGRTWDQEWSQCMGCLVQYQPTIVRATVPLVPLKLQKEHHNIKGKAVPQHTYEGARRERRYSSYLFTTSALNGGKRSASRPGQALPPGKGSLVSIVQKAGWAQEQVRTKRLEEKSSCLCRGSNVYCPVVQYVARH
jgi:hypothetical protein